MFPRLQHYSILVSSMLIFPGIYRSACSPEELIVTLSTVKNTCTQSSFEGCKKSLTLLRDEQGPTAATAAVLQSSGSSCRGWLSSGPRGPLELLSRSVVVMSKPGASRPGGSLSLKHQMTLCLGFRSVEGSLVGPGWKSPVLCMM